MAAFNFALATAPRSQRVVFIAMHGLVAGIAFLPGLLMGALLPLTARISVTRRRAAADLGRLVASLLRLTSEESRAAVAEVRAGIDRLRHAFAGCGWWRPRYGCRLV